MWTRLYTIYDLCAEEATGQLQYTLQSFPNDHAAMRWFTDIVATTGTMIHQHPEDYNLYFLGELNTESLEIHSRSQALNNEPINEDSCIILEGKTVKELLDAQTSGQVTRQETATA